MLACTTASQPQQVSAFLLSDCCAFTASSTKKQTSDVSRSAHISPLPPSDLAVIWIATPLVWAPLWPCTESYMCWWSRVFQMMFHTVRVDLSEQGEKIKTFPGNRHIPQTALECFYRRPRDLQRQVWLRLPSSSPDIVYRYFFFLYELQINHCCCFLHFIFQLLFPCIADPGNVWLMAYKLERYTTNRLWFPAPPPPRPFISTLSNAVICQINWTIRTISY